MAPRHRGFVQVNVVVGQAPDTNLIVLQRNGRSAARRLKRDIPVHRDTGLPGSITRRTTGTHAKRHTVIAPSYSSGWTRSKARTV